MPNQPEKRSNADDIVLEMKRVKVETPTLEHKTTTALATNTGPPKFVSAAMLVTSVEEITDEELLEFTLEFERKHGI